MRLSFCSDGQVCEQRASLGLCRLATRLPRLGPSLVVPVALPGASNGALDKYSAVWRRLGCDTMAFAPSVPYVWFESLSEPVVDRLLSDGLLYAEHEHGSPPWLLHAFSGACSMFYPRIAAGLGAGPGRSMARTHVCGIACTTVVARRLWRDEWRAPLTFRLRACAGPAGDSANRPLAGCVYDSSPVDFTRASGLAAAASAQEHCAPCMC